MKETPDSFQIKRIRHTTLLPLIRTLAAGRHGGAPPIDIARRRGSADHRAVTSRVHKCNEIVSILATGVVTAHE
jgi:hypothetical protein